MLIIAITNFTACNDLDGNGGEGWKIQVCDDSSVPYSIPQEQRVAGSFYVSPIGCNLNDGSELSPWRTLSFACNQVKEGSTIYLLAGTIYEDSICRVPRNVSIIGKGRTITTLKSRYFYKGIVGAWDLGKNKYLIQYADSCDGIEISNFTLDGNNHQSHGGMIINNAKNVNIKNLFVKDFNFNGIWVANSENLNIDKINMSETSLPSTNSCSGMLMLGTTTNAEISNCVFTNSNKEYGGYGIKTWDYNWNSYQNPAGQTIKLTNVNIHDCKFDLYPYGGWNNGTSVNICVELYSTSLDQCMITDNIFIGNLSMVGQNKPNVEYAAKVINNQFLMPTINEGAQFAIENEFSNVEIANNFFQNGMYSIACFNVREVSNLNVHHNVFDKIKLPKGILVFDGWPRNLKVENNTVLYDQSIFNWYLGATNGNTLIYTNNPAIAELISIQNNIFYCYDGDKKNNIRLIQGPQGDVTNAANVTINNNAFYNWIVDGANYLELPMGSPVFNFSGSGYKQIFGLKSESVAFGKNLGALN